MTPITGKTYFMVLIFWRVLCYDIPLAYAVERFFESVEFKLHSS